MNYDQDLINIKTLLPDVDFIKEKDFYLFENKDFAKKAFNYFIEATENIRAKLNLELYFAFRFRQTFNAEAHKIDDKYIIIINHSVIDQLEKMIQNSISLFQKENITKLTGLPTDKHTLKELFIYIITSYLFYHELAHILQFSFSEFKTSMFQEEYNKNSTYNFKNHIYEIDADLFGISLGTILILQYLKENKIPENHVILFNLLTLYILIVANIFIAFSKDISNIYYKDFSHPHPIMRIVRCVEQILILVKENTKISINFFDAIIQRYSKILDVMHFQNESNLIYNEIVKENYDHIIRYLEEIESHNEQFQELSRYRIDEIYNLLGK